MATVAVRAVEVAEMMEFEVEAEATVAVDTSAAIAEVVLAGGGTVVVVAVDFAAMAALVAALVAVDSVEVVTIANFLAAVVDADDTETMTLMFAPVSADRVAVVAAAGFAVP